ncbi:metastasis-associated protein 3 [Danaus plexippus plexippus]|uniref:Metastasis-associated protein 3 n=1 Tax=Danaus plexippus plexippus TaxID=278856 RepID=A0A212F4Z5_DANPL|nr:metastasis-associated protein 3 [Danaus plexippus plexippus]
MACAGGEGVAQSEDSPVAMKLKKICLKTPIGEEQAAQAVLDPAIAFIDLSKYHKVVTPSDIEVYNLKGGTYIGPSEVYPSMYCGSGLVRGSRGKGPPGADLRGGGVVVEEVEVVVARPSLAGYRLEHPLLLRPRAAVYPPPHPSVAREPDLVTPPLCTATLKRIRFSRCENDAFLPRGRPPRCPHPPPPTADTNERNTYNINYTLELGK